MDQSMDVSFMKNCKVCGAKTANSADLVERLCDRTLPELLQYICGGKLKNESGIEEKLIYCQNCILAMVQAFNTTEKVRRAFRGQMVDITNSAPAKRLFLAPIISVQNSNVSYNDQSTLEQSAAADTTQRAFSCDYCPFECAAPKTYKLHLKTEHQVENPLIFKCMQCSMAFPTSVTLRRHFTDLHEKKLRARNYHCADCNKDFFHHKTLKIHINEHHARVNASTVSATAGRAQQTSSVQRQDDAVAAQPTKTSLRQNNHKLPKEVPKDTEEENTAVAPSPPPPPLLRRERMTDQRDGGTMPTNTMDNSDEVELERYECEHCGFVMRTQKKLNKHIKQEHGIRVAVNNADRQCVANETANSPKRARYYSYSASGAENHTEVAERDSKVTTAAKRLRSSAVRTQRFPKTAMARPGPVCIGCGKRFQNGDSLRAHMQTTHMMKTSHKSRYFSEDIDDAPEPFSDEFQDEM